MTLYRDLHANPELSMQETRSAARMADEARRAGFTVTTGVGGTGVVAVMANGPGPVLLLRADMDALPVEEQTGLPFASRVRGTTREGAATGVMHACGHDTHMTTWVGTARRMAAMRSQWSGTLVMIAQPGEEIGAGARAMLDDGLYTRFPHPTHAIAFHDSASLPAGMIGYATGPALANVNSVDIQVRGVGGHGAYPHTTKDPIVLGAPHRHRAADPGQPRDQPTGQRRRHRRQLPWRHQAQHHLRRGRLQLTVRSFTPEVRTQLLEGIARIARGEAIAAGVAEDRMPVVTVREGDITPATINTPALTQSTAALFRAHFGEARVTRSPAGNGRRGFQPLQYRRSPDRKLHLLGRRRSAGALGRDPVAIPRNCPRSTAPSGRRTPKR